MDLTTKDKTTTNQFGPLNLSNKQKLSNENLQTKCPLCDDKFNLIICQNLFQKHLLIVHSIIIENLDNINKLPEYLNYWNRKFKKTPPTEILPSIEPRDSPKTIYLLTELLEEDKILRHQLKLESTLELHEFERNDENYRRNCLYCKFSFEGKRANYLKHLSEQHNLQLGDPNNLIFIDELIEKINEKLDKLQCIYCLKIFPERNVLKEHMRKKLHKRINPNNTEYDRFYIVNYLESGKTWQTIQKEDDRYALTPGYVPNGDAEYSDWCEKNVLITCLFCDKIDDNINNICLHLDADHDFDFIELTKNWNFYQKIKFVNYQRKSIFNYQCGYCLEKFEDKYQLNKHLYREKHCKIPDLQQFDQPEYYFPTYEDDAFLYYIDDVD